MDPDYCLGTFLNAWSDSDHDVAEEHVEALRVWLIKGGYVPTVSKETLLRIIDMMMAAL